LSIKPVIIDKVPFFDIKVVFFIDKPIYHQNSIFYNKN
jgi:hypothetical protein